MKKILTASIALLLVSGVAVKIFAEDIVHTVKKGDTLWDISMDYLKTPWSWPIVWANNEDITNPHLIYPGDKIIIRKSENGVEIVVVRTDKALPEEEVFTPEEFTEQKERTIVVSPEYSNLIYTKTLLTGIGEFVEKEDIGRLVAVEDTILVKMSGTMQPEEIIALLSREMEIRGETRNTRAYLGNIPIKAKGFDRKGYLYKIAALAKVLEVHGDIARCKVIYSSQEVENGDIAYDLKEIISPLTLSISFPQITAPAKIIDLYGGLTKNSANDIAFLDIGEAQGITPGNLLGIYATNPSHESTSPYRGMILVLKTLDNTSMGIVMESRTEIERGFLVKDVGNSTQK